MDQAKIEKVNAYKPSQAVLARMASIKLLATVGPSAVGKSYVMSALCQKYPDQFKSVVDETTRPPRVYETEGVDFIFRKEEEVLADLDRGELVQAAIGPNGNIYSTRLQSYPSGATGVIALIPSTVMQFRQLPIKEFHAAFIVPPSFETWQAWLARQAAISDWSEMQYRGRLQEARRSFEFALNDPQIKFVLNDDVAKTVERLAQVARGESPEDEAKAKEIAEQNYTELRNNEPPAE